MRKQTRISWLFAAILGMLTGPAFAQDPAHHGPMGIEGFQLLSSVPFAPGQVVMFQQIVPCRLVDTRLDQKFDDAHGAPHLAAGEARFYVVSGTLPAENGCGLSNRRLVDPDAVEIPRGILGLSVRVSVINAETTAIAGVLNAGPVSPSEGAFAFWFGWAGTSVANYQEDLVAVEKSDGTLRIALLPGAGADVMVDVLGYIQADTSTTGVTGPQGPKGDTGATGPQGLKGEIGPLGPQGVKGDTGVQGPIGLTGAKGDTGATGPQGLKGEIGPLGPQGLKGDTGALGPIGLTGAKGDTGATGSQGLKGDIGPVGPQGIKGDTGLTGALGPKGDTGATGAQGLKGDTGTTGPMGPSGATGSIGPQGPQGPVGPSGAIVMSAGIGTICGTSSPTSLTRRPEATLLPRVLDGDDKDWPICSTVITDASIKAGSTIMATYNTRSTDEQIPIRIFSVQNGSFHVEGQSGQKFSWLSFNPM